MFEQMPSLLFGLFAVLALVFSILVISLKNPVSSAFSLVMVLFNVAALFAMQEAHFAAAIQILVYAGAIMVLFVFVIMLLNIDRVPLDFPRSRIQYGLAGVLAFSFFALVSYVFVNGGTSTAVGVFDATYIAQNGGNFRMIARDMFTKHVYAFELVAVLLMVAVVGAIVLAKRKVD